MLKRGLSFLLPLVGLHFFIDRFHPIYNVPELDEDDYYGNGSVRADEDIISDFKISFDKDTIEDLKRRVKDGLKRQFTPLENNFELGVNLNYLQNISEPFLNFDWRQHQYFLNTFDHYITEIEGIGIHFLRMNYPVKPGQKKFPILLIHGFPNSFWDFYKIIPVLANPSRFGYDFGGKNTIVFDVIVPSIPGFGFSEKPSKSGVGFVECARIFGKLMSRLGHDRYFIHGSSIVGSQVGSALAAIQPQAIMGLHMSDPYIDVTSSWLFMAKYYWSRSWASFVHYEYSSGLNLHESYYDRPDTLSVAINDSPLGLTAFLMDRWARGTSQNFKTHAQGELQTHYTVDELLTEVYIYWLTGTFPTAARFLYYSRNHPLGSQFSRATIGIPTGIINFPQTPHQMPYSILKLKYHNITRFVEASNGGEFAAIESWKKLSEEIFSFVELVTL
uniref:Epoxide hydrolase n=1 Tax=Acrobeloides nanus TaxID=290746 RepID=A0A914CGB1_9BILA